MEGGRGIPFRSCSGHRWLDLKGRRGKIRPDCPSLVSLVAGNGGRRKHVGAPGEGHGEELNFTGHFLCRLLDEMLSPISSHLILKDDV